MNARNAKYIDALNTIINLEYEHPTYGWIPYTATASDAEQLGQDLFAAAVAGDFGVVAAYVAPTAQEELDNARASAVLSRMEFMIALDANGLLTTVENAVNDAGTSTQIKLMWANASSFERMHPDLITFAQSIPLTDTQVDTVFGLI